MKHLPLTKAQKNIYLGQILDPEAPLYNMAHAFYFELALDADKFYNTYQKLVSNFDCLRLTFHNQNGNIYQSCLNYVDNHTTIDATNWDNKQLQQYLKKQAKQLFKLNESCHKSILIQQGSKSTWFFSMHHLISDATTFQLLFSAVNKFYHDRDEIIKQGSFTQYLQKENKQVVDPSIIEYWNEFTQKRTSLALYGKVVNTTSSKAKRVTLQLNNQETLEIYSLLEQSPFKSLSTQLSLYQFFGTCLTVLLHKVSEEKIIRIGSASHNRFTKTAKQTPGLFVEIYPLELAVKEEDNFKSLFSNYQQTSFELFKNARPGIVDESISDSYSVVYNYTNMAIEKFDSCNCTTELIFIDHIDRAHAFRLQVEDFNRTGRLTIHIDGNQQWFSDIKIASIKTHFKNVITEFVNNPQQNISSLNILSDEDQNYYKSHEEISYSETYLDKIINKANKSPNAIALIENNKKITYEELIKSSTKLANGLQKNGFSNGHILLNYRRSTDYIISVIGCLLANCSFTPLPINTPKKRIEYIYNNCKASLILSEKELIGLPSERIDSFINNNELEFHYQATSIDRIAYILYTSGSTGKPKGVKVSHQALTNYLTWANAFYLNEAPVIAPLYSSIGFDLTITSTFLPLMSGGTIHLYPESLDSSGQEVTAVFENKELNLIKATPTHLELVKKHLQENSNLKALIVGGEQFKTSLANIFQTHYGPTLSIYNEYGPTEATVGSIIHKYDIESDKDSAVPIGKAIDNLSAFILNTELRAVPQGVTGELYLSGLSLAKGYVNDHNLTQEKFITIPNYQSIFYATGDKARINEEGLIEYIGRKDNQVKINGYRIELNEISASLSEIVNNQLSIVRLWDNDERNNPKKLTYCNTCGLPSNHPSATYSEDGICNFCQRFNDYQKQVQNYFQSINSLEGILKSKRNKERSYDCIMLLSGGKDSTYALAKLVELGINVLAYTFDNGYISKEAITNAKNICQQLNVEHIIGRTDAMNKIFVDSLNRFSNVCNGCFKTIYTLSTHLALEKKIPFIVTGLSRGQFFETRLTEELFTSMTSIQDIDQIILNARKEYHRVTDAVSELLDVSIFDSDELFEQVEFIDFYRFCDSSLQEMYAYLDSKLNWRRPSDTGRSTNCLINQVGIYVHKKKEGYSNYAFPYSWDVRVGHKTRNESIEEINEEINEDAVFQMMDEIGYDKSELNTNQYLVGYYEGEAIPESEIRKKMQEKLPAYMIPNRFVAVDKMPINQNGKVDVKQLPNPTLFLNRKKQVISPRDEIEQVIHDIWAEVLQLNNISIYDEFISLGGNSLSAIRITSRVKDAIRLQIPLREVFDKSTIAQYARLITRTIEQKLKEINAN